MSRTINRRYIVGESLGKGAMGEVFLAQDRLTGSTVALKRVHASLSLGDDRMTSEELRLTLAQEFEALASLRHPNIISVSDYGFDGEHRPYFTMEYLENARTIIEAGQGQPLTVQVDLLAQMLRALSYIHRRGILHRDLKPGNVLVIERGGQRVVKVLDFGLASGLNHAKAVSGTLSYAAPEVIGGKAPITYAADLYSVGVIAYEMFTGRYPFADKPLHVLMQHVLYTPVDLSVIPLDMRMLVGWLLTKSPEDRYASAEAAIKALSDAIRADIPIDTVSTRESFLQASRFVGREKELTTLVAALKRAKTGLGSAWLIAGESGVGKTRLVDELSTRALVDGALVLRSYLPETGGKPYEAWRSPLRQLVLGLELAPLEIDVLKALVPDIETLIAKTDRGSDEPIMTELTGEAASQRLFAIIIDLFRRQSELLVLIIEDLHWGVESLDLLKQMIEAQLPMLIIGTYRADERPNLPERLPVARVLPLERLTTAEIAELTESMLGHQRPEVVEMLEHETEGNIFFLVETVRALAEEAGDLDKVGRSTLPKAILSGGVQAILRRRLSHVRAGAQPLLKLVAVQGRQIDLAMLSWLASTHGVDDVEGWVIETINAAVGEVEGEVWRFAHEKLRQTALADLDARERQQLHQHVAVSIETFYSDPLLHAEALRYHWHEAGDASKEVKYLIMAAERAVKLTALFDVALTWLQRALDILESQPDDPRRGSVYILMGRAHFFIGQQDEARSYLKKALDFGFPEIEAAARLGLAEVEIRAGHLDRANSNARLGLVYYRRIDNKSGVADALQMMAQVAIETGAYARAGVYLTEALMLRTALNEPQGLGMCHDLLGRVNLFQGMDDHARHHYDASLRIRRALGDIRGMSDTFNHLALLAQNRAEYDTAWNYQEESLALKRRIHDRHGVGGSLCHLSYLALLRGDLDLAEDLCDEALALYREIDDQRGLSIILTHLALISMNRELDDLAKSYFEKSHALKLTLADRAGETAYALNYGVFQLVRGETRAAGALFQQAGELAQALSERSLEGSALLHAGLVAEIEGRLDDALALLGRARTIFRNRHAPRETALALIALARVGAAQSNFEGVFDALHEAATIVTQLNLRGDKLLLLISAAYVDWRLGKLHTAAACLALLSREPMTHRLVRYYYRRLRAEIGPELQPVEVTSDLQPPVNLDDCLARLHNAASSITSDAAAN